MFKWDKSYTIIIVANVIYVFCFWLLTLKFS